MMLWNVVKVKANKWCFLQVSQDNFQLNNKLSIKKRAKFSKRLF